MSTEYTQFIIIPRAFEGFAKVMMLQAYNLWWKGGGVMISNTPNVQRPRIQI